MTETALGWKSLICFNRSRVFLPAARAMTLYFSGLDRITFNALIPMEPVEPNMAILFLFIHPTLCEAKGIHRAKEWQKEDYQSCLRLLHALGEFGLNLLLHGSFSTSILQGPLLALLWKALE